MLISNFNYDEVVWDDYPFSRRSQLQMTYPATTLFPLVLNAYCSVSQPTSVPSHSRWKHKVLGFGKHVS
jgi:hypothetical protein